MAKWQCGCCVKDMHVWCDKDTVSTDVRKPSCPVILPCITRGIMSCCSVMSDLSPAWEDEDKTASPRVRSIVVSIMLETLPLVSHWMEQSNNNGRSIWQVTFITATHSRLRSTLSGKEKKVTEIKAKHELTLVLVSTTVDSSLPVNGDGVWWWACNVSSTLVSKQQFQNGS